MAISSSSVAVVLGVVMGAALSAHPPASVSAVLLNGAAEQASTTNAELVCEVTQPNGLRVAWATLPPSPYWHGTDGLSTTLWPGGTIEFRPSGPGTVLPDGSLRMKFLWFKARSPMTIEGRRLDAPAQSLRAEINHAFDGEDFQPSHLVFATTGCWEVAAKAGDSALTFVTRVIKIGDGPTTKTKAG